jgi:hypothetical protein
MYALLRPVSRNLALLAVCFGLTGTEIFAAGEMLYFAAALPAVDADVARCALGGIRFKKTKPRADGGRSVKKSHQKQIRQILSPLKNFSG